MVKVNPYMDFNCTCEKSFHFYKSVFGGDFVVFSRFKDVPPMEWIVLPDDAKDKMMHVSLPISKDSVLMGSDANPAFGKITVGENISLSVSTETKNEADHIFNTLSEGGKITMPIADTFWGTYFGMLVDQFGNLWMVSFDQART